MTDTTHTNQTAIILPTDKLGRVKMPAERREALLKEYEKSGMSGQAFAAWAGINYQTFATWVQKRRKKKKPEKMKWVEAVVEKEADPRGESKTEALVVHLTCGARLEVRTVAQAALASELLRGMGVRC